MDQKPTKQQNDIPGTPLLLSIRQTAKVLNLGCTKVYEPIATEGLPTQRLGRARRVVYSRLLHWLEQRDAQHQWRRGQTGTFFTSCVHVASVG